MHNRRTSPVSFAPLESRRLFAVTLNSGLLSVVGSNHIDHVSITADGAEIVVHTRGPDQRFAAADVSEIYIRGRAGGDEVVVNLPELRPTVRIYGDDGIDHLEVL